MPFAWRSIPPADARAPRLSVIVAMHGARVADVAAFLARMPRGGRGAIEVLACVDPPLAAQASARLQCANLRLIAAGGAGTYAMLRQALAHARGDFVIELHAADRLARNVPRALSAAVDRFPDADAFYADVACLSAGRDRRVLLKPAWNPELFKSMDYVGGFLAIRRQCLLDYSPTARHAEIAWQTDLLLHLARREGAIRHIPQVLLERRECADTQTGNPIDLPARMAVMASILGEDGEVTLAPGALPGTLRLRYALRLPAPKVEIIIPTRNGGALLRRCVASVLERTRDVDFALTLVDNQSDDVDTCRFLDDMAGRDGVRILPFHQPFNYAAINNRAVGATAADVVCLLNDDVEVIEPDWLRELVSHAVRPEVGAVGAKLLYQDGRVQHAGIVVGMRRSAAHAHKNMAGEAPGYMGRLQVAQNCTAVTGACLVVRRALYLGLGGLNEGDLAVAYNDVDFCLRLREAGYLNVWTPHALLYHHESASRGREDTPAKRGRLKAEAAYMNRRWGMKRFADPYFHPGLTRAREDFSMRHWLFVRLPGHQDVAR